MSLNKKQQAYADMRQRVLSLDLAPGASLDEAVLSERYGLSRTPMRELLQRLSGEGYVSLEPNRGATVAAMDLETMRSFFQTAPMIYCAIARLASQNASAQQIAALRKLQDRFRKAVQSDDASQMSLLNHQFHEAIGDMSGNGYLQPSLNRLLIDHTRMSHRFYRPRATGNKRRVSQACKQHDQLIGAIEAGDGERAAAISMQHWELSRGEIEKYVQPEPLPTDNMFQPTESAPHAV